jgi:hypothetical protein
MERRRHNRICTSIPVKIHVKIPESPKVSWTNFGVLKNLSYGGAYFTSNDTPPLKQGQIREFTITPTEEPPNFPGVTFINGTSRVIRVDSPSSGDHDIGVALELLSGTFCNMPIKSTSPVR